MVKPGRIQFILTAAGLMIMMGVSLSNTTPTAKGIGLVLAVFLITFGVIVTGPLQKYFEYTREGNIPRPENSMDFR